MSTAIRRRLIPYLLMGPGLIWLILFFVVPVYFMGRLSLESGTLETGFEFTWSWSNFSNSLSRFDTQFVRSFVYAGSATLIALLIAYPLAYAIAFRGGRWKNALLLAVVAPFFTTYLIRTIAWETILGDSGFVVDTLKTFALLGDDGRLLATPTAGDYVNAFYLGSAQQAMIGNRIQSLYQVERDYPTAASLSFTMMAIILLIVIVYIRFAGSEALM